MNERKFLKLNQLCIWTDNPRYGKISNDNQMTEKEAINLLIDVVGEKKMINLVNDIIEFKGLNGNVIPTVVQKDELFYVYDGNRRVSSMKIIQNPNILDDKFIQLKRNIEKKLSDFDSDVLNNVFVLITNEDEALRLMDKTHSGEQKGVGVIQWDSFNRDISLSSRGLNPIYPVAYKIFVILGWNSKNDADIYYTDAQRLFSSQKLLSSFKIVELTDKYKEQIQEAIGALLSFVEARKIKSLSRFFNITDTSVDADSVKPINEFIEYWNQSQLSNSKYEIKIDTKKIFNDSIYNFDPSTIHIIDKESNNEVTFSKDEISVSYEDPTGKVKNNVEPKIAGVWNIIVHYKGISCRGNIDIQTVMSEPFVQFDSNKLKVNNGETLNLCSVVKIAKSVHGYDMKLLSVVPLGANCPKVKNNILSSDNKVGNYILSYRFDNDGAEYAKNITVTIVPVTKPAVNNAVDYPISFKGNYSITFSSDVATLIEEINELWVTTEKYRHIICCSARAVLELCIDYIYSVETSLTNTEKFEPKVEGVMSYLLSNNEKLKSICDAMKVSFLETKNELTQLKENVHEFVTALHIGAHKSASALDPANLFNKMHVYLALIILIAEGIKLTQEH